MSQAIYTVNAHGNIKNIGRDFRSYDYDTVEKCAGLFLGDSQNKYVLRTRKLGGSKSDFEWNQNSVILYAESTPNAHESVLRLMRIGDVDKLPGYCFVVTEFGKPTLFRGVFDNRSDLEAYIGSKTEEECEDLYIRIVQFNKVLS